MGAEDIMTSFKDGDDGDGYIDMELVIKPVERGHILRIMSDYDERTMVTLDSEPEVLMKNIADALGLKGIRISTVKSV